MQVSARNLIPGTIVSITPGAVNVELIIEVAPQLQLVSIITKQACERLQLKVGMPAHAAINASNVMIATEPSL